MKKILVLNALVMLLLASCSKDKTINPGNPSTAKKLVMTSSANHQEAITYNPDGTIDKIKGVLGGKPLERSFTYNPGSVLFTIQVDGKMTHKAIQTIVNGRITENEYTNFDDQGNILHHDTQKFTYNDEGKLQKVLLTGSNYYTLYEYSFDGNLQSIKSFGDNGLIWRKESFEYTNIPDRNTWYKQDINTSGSGQFLPAFYKNLVKKVTATDYYTNNSENKWRETDYTYELDNDGYVIKAEAKDLKEPSYNNISTHTWQ